MSAQLFLLAQAGFEMSVKDLVLQSGPVAKLVLLILFVFSIVTWAIIGAKWLMLSRARRESARFLRLFRQAGSPGKILSRVSSLRGTPLLRLLREAYSEVQNLNSAGQEREEDDFPAMGKRMDEQTASTRSITLRPDQIKFIASVLERARGEETARMELSVPFLATAGSTAPFIGLFGTVWGVMRAFQGIGTAQSTSIGAVAPGISEALIATAGGLVAAIPAVMAYNHFVNKVRQLNKIMENFSGELLDYLEKRYCSP
jgi:biopolymer transport protein TolQ